MWWCCSDLCPRFFFSIYQHRNAITVQYERTFIAHCYYDKMIVFVTIEQVVVRPSSLILYIISFKDEIRNFMWFYVYWDPDKKKNVGLIYKPDYVVYDHCIYNSTWKALSILILNNNAKERKTGFTLSDFNIDLLKCYDNKQVNTSVNLMYSYSFSLVLTTQVVFSQPKRNNHPPHWQYFHWFWPWNKIGKIK